MAKKIVINKRGADAPPPDDPEQEEFDEYEDDEYEDYEDDDYEDEDSEGGGLDQKLTFRKGGASPEWADKERTHNPVDPRYRAAGGQKGQIRVQGGAGRKGTYRKARKGKSVIKKTSGAGRDLERAKKRGKSGSGGKGGTYFLIALLVIAIGIGGFFAAKIMRGPTAANMGGVQGEVKIAYADQAKQAEPHMRVRSGSLITTGADSKAFLTMLDGTQIQLEQNSKMRIWLIKQNAIQYRGNRVKLEEGEIFLEVLEQDPMFPMKVLTPYTQCVLTGARFGLSFTNDVATVLVSKGSVKFVRTEDMSKIDVVAGSFATVATGVPFSARSISSESRVLRLSLAEAGSGRVIEGREMLRSGDTLNMEKISGYFAVKAETDPKVVGSVKFRVTRGGQVKETILNNPPYMFSGSEKALIGDAWEPTDGLYKLEVWSYSMPDATGMRGAPKVIKLKVIGSAP